MQPNVPAEPRGYRITSAELRRLADALDTLPPGDKPPYTSLALLPDEKTADVVDALALAVGAKPGKTEPNGSGGWRHTAELWMVRERFSLTIHATVPGPADKRDAEIERLKAELAAAQAGRGSEVDDPSGTGYSEVVREPEQVEAPADITTTAYPVRGAAANGGGPFTRYFSFGIGQTDPKTGANLRNKYVTVVAPTAEGCREAMLASRFGREWSMEYIPGQPHTDERIARWTEHDRIVVGVATEDPEEWLRRTVDADEAKRIVDAGGTILPDRRLSGAIRYRVVDGGRSPVGRWMAASAAARAALIDEAHAEARGIWLDKLGDQLRAAPYPAAVIDEKHAEALAEESDRSAPGGCE